MIIIVDKGMPKNKSKRRKYLLLKYGSGTVDSGHVFFTKHNINS